MLTLRETIFHNENEQKITEKGFENKSQIIRALKRNAPLPNSVIDELAKHNEVEFEYDGKKRIFEIFRDEEIDL
jgi:hypothetical protein